LVIDKTSVVVLSEMTVGKIHHKPKEEGLMALSIEEMESELVEAIPAREVMCGYSGCGYSYSNHQYQSGNGNFDGNGNGNGSFLGGNGDGDFNGTAVTVVL
jgi:hypothetical protein